MARRKPRPPSPPPQDQGAHDEDKSSSDDAKQNNNAKETTKIEKKKYEWTIHYDNEGRLYYYNETTDESTWEAPAEGFNPPEGVETGDTAAATQWVVFHDEKGQEYYYNNKSGETSWDKPETTKESAREAPAEGLEDGGGWRVVVENEDMVPSGQMCKISFIINGAERSFAAPFALHQKGKEAVDCIPTSFSLPKHVSAGGAVVSMLDFACKEKLDIDRFTLHFYCLARAIGNKFAVVEGSEELELSDLCSLRDNDANNEAGGPSDRDTPLVVALSKFIRQKYEFRLVHMTFNDLYHDFLFAKKVKESSSTRDEKHWGYIQKTIANMMGDLSATSTRKLDLKSMSGVSSDSAFWKPFVEGHLYKKKKKRQKGVVASNNESIESLCAMFVMAFRDLEESESPMSYETFQIATSMFPAVHWKLAMDLLMMEKRLRPSECENATSENETMCVEALVVNWWRFSNHDKKETVNFFFTSENAGKMFLHGLGKEVDDAEKNTDPMESAGVALRLVKLEQKLVGDKRGDRDEFTPLQGRLRDALLLNPRSVADAELLDAFQGLPLPIVTKLFGELLSALDTAIATVTDAADADAL